MVVLGVACLRMKKLQENTSNIGTQQQSGTQSETERNIVYSNLADKKTQEEVAQIMKKAGIESTAIDLYMEWVKDFYSRIEATDAIKPGYQQLPDSMEVDYSSVFLESRYLEDSIMQLDPNCRLTTFLLMNSMITSNRVYDTEDTYLMFDVEALMIDPMYERLLPMIDSFITLYQPVDVTVESKYDEHVQNILDEWKQREIQIEESDTISLITVFLHDNLDNKRFVGHVGVKMEMDGVIWFLEKYASGLPYQITKFHTNEELSDYLLSRADFYGDRTEEKPIIMENDHLLIQ